MESCSASNRISAGSIESSSIVVNTCINQAPSSNPCLKSLPASVVEPFGREGDWGELKESIADTGRHIVLVEGIPGIGKTTCVKKWAEELKDRYPDAWIYVDFDDHRIHGQASVYDVLRLFLLDSGIALAGEPLDDGRALALYRSFLHDKRCLVLLDHVIDDAEVEAFVPSSGDCLVLVGRQSSGLEGWEKSCEVELKPFDQEKSLAFLQNKAPGRFQGNAIARNDISSIESILEYCDGIPLYLSGAASLLCKKALALNDIAARLPSKSRSWPFDAMLDTCLEQLSHDGEVLYVLIGDYPLKRVRTAALRFACDRIDYPKAIEELEDLHLIDCETVPQYDCLHEGDVFVVMHRRIKEHAKSKIGVVDILHERERLIRYYRMLAQEMDYASTASRLRMYRRIDGEGVAFADMLEHRTPQSLFLRFQVEFSAVVTWATKHGNCLEHAWSIAEALWTFYYENGLYETASVVYRDAVGAAMADGREGAVARLLALQSRCLLILGDMEQAKSLLERAYERAEPLGNEGLLGSLAEFMGSTLRRMGSFEESIAWYREAKAHHMLHTGTYSRGCAISDYLMSLALIELGRRGGAHEALERALRNLEPDDVAIVSKARIALARLYDVEGNLEGALEEYAKADALLKLDEVPARRACLLREYADVARRLRMSDLYEHLSSLANELGSDCAVLGE